MNVYVMNQYIEELHTIMFVKQNVEGIQNMLELYMRHSFRTMYKST